MSSTRPVFRRHATSTATMFRSQAVEWVLWPKHAINQGLMEQLSDYILGEPDDNGGENNARFERVVNSWFDGIPSKQISLSHNDVTRNVENLGPMVTDLKRQTKRSANTRSTQCFQFGYWTLAKHISCPNWTYLKKLESGSTLWPCVTGALAKHLSDLNEDVTLGIRHASGCRMVCPHFRFARAVLSHHSSLRTVRDFVCD